VRLWLTSTWAEPFVSLPYIDQHGPNAVRDRTKAKSVVSILEEHGHLLAADGTVEIRGTGRRECWRVIRGAQT
jgi:hypothetical protein